MNTAEELTEQQLRELEQDLQQQRAELQEQLDRTVADSQPVALDQQWWDDSRAWMPCNSNKWLVPMPAR